jgi:hypothetical protein
MVERFSAEISANSLKRGEFKSLAALETAIMACPETRTANPKPFVWTATPRNIPEKLHRRNERWSQDTSSLPARLWPVPARSVMAAAAIEKIIAGIAAEDISADIIIGD